SASMPMLAAFTVLLAITDTLPVVAPAPWPPATIAALAAPAAVLVTMPLLITSTLPVVEVAVMPLLAPATPAVCTVTLPLPAAVPPRAGGVAVGGVAGDLPADRGDPHIAGAARGPQDAGVPRPRPAGHAGDVPGPAARADAEGAKPAGRGHVAGGVDVH